MYRCAVNETSETDVSEIREILSRFWDQLIAREHGPLAFRLILQPIMATILAIRDGLKDTRAGRPLYTWTIFERFGASGSLSSRGCEESKQSHRLRTSDGRDLPVLGPGQVLSGRSADDRVGGSGSPLLVDSGAGRAHRARLEAARRCLRRAVRIEAWEPGRRARRKARSCG